MSKVIFENKGYQINRVNRCCVCGSKQDLTRHHIFPSCYTSFLDKEIKKQLRQEHQFYYEWEYCCVCKEHHHLYETKFGVLLHKIIWEKYDVDLSQTSYRQVKSLLPKPGKIVAAKIKTKSDYFELRDFCIAFFKEKMKPQYPLL
jgi:hypothetical protein